MKKLFFLGLITLFFVSCASSLNSEDIHSERTAEGPQDDIQKFKQTFSLNYEKEKANKYRTQQESSR